MVIGIWFTEVKGLFSFFRNVYTIDNNVINTRAETCEKSFPWSFGNNSFYTKSFRNTFGNFYVIANKFIIFIMIREWLPCAFKTNAQFTSILDTGK